MDNAKVRNYHLIRMMVFIICFGVIIASLYGCEPFRKKFVREKKKGEQKEEFIPVLEPIDYAERVYSSEERYRKHYSLWRVWDKELNQVLSRGGVSDKRQKYLLAQVLGQLEEMKNWLIDPKLQEFSGVVDGYYSVQKRYEKPAQLRNMHIIRLKLERSAKKIRNEFNPKLLQDYFKSP